MADQFDDYQESEERFNERRDRINEFYHYLDATYRNIRKVPTTFEGEREQKDYIIRELVELRERIYNFIGELER